jgi:ribosomal protein L37E
MMELCPRISLKNSAKCSACGFPEIAGDDWIIE